MRQEHWIYTVPLRLRSLFRRRVVDSELDDELQFHMERQMEVRIAEGLAPEEAQLAALRALGSLAQVKEECREMRRINLVENLMQDVRLAGRVFRKSPGFTAVALLSLALGIGANTAIFSLIDAILLRTLPVSHAEQLAVLTSYSRPGKTGDFSYPDYVDLRDRSRAFSGLLAASRAARIEAGSGAGTEPAQRKIVSGNYFAVLGVQPALGRLLSEEDDRLPVAVIGYSFWKRNFGESPSVLGKQITLDGLPVNVIGVAPPGFFGETPGEAPDIWASMSAQQADLRNQRGFTWLNLIGRLRSGQDFKQASAELNVLVPQISAGSRPAGGSIQRIAVEPGSRGLSGLRDRFSDPLRLLMAVVALVLLLACANLASLLLARAATRQREIATRLAIGASRARLIRQLLTESVLLAVLGGIAGLLFALWSSRLLLTMVSGGTQAIMLDLRPGLTTLLFTAAISLVTGVLFGVTPALQAVRRDVSPTLRLTAGNIAGRRGRRSLGNALLASQVALSLLLVTGAGLFVRTLHNLKNQDVGFEADNVVSIGLSPQRGYRPQWGPLVVRLLHRIQAIPGIRSASVSFNGTLADSGSGVAGLNIEGYLPKDREERQAHADWVGADYFGTSGIRLLEGRDFSLRDNAAAPKIAVINQTMARHYFGNASAVGRRFEFNKNWFQIVGVARDAKYTDLRESTPRMVYLGVLQTGSGVITLEVRTASSPLAVAGALRDAVREVDPGLRIGEFSTLRTRIDRKLNREHLITDISGFFGGLTLLLVSIGIYGTLAYAVAQRTNEIGVRMALGAPAAFVLRLVLQDVLFVLTAGLLAGVAAVLVCGRLVASMLFGLKPTDLATILLAIVVLSAIALAAGYIPARRASRIDSLAALRFE